MGGWMRGFVGIRMELEARWGTGGRYERAAWMTEAAFLFRGLGGANGGQNP